MSEIEAVPGLRIVPAAREHVPLILELIRELAAYEREPEAVVATEALVEAALFGERPAAEAVVAYLGAEAAGFALWFQTFSTWTGRPGLWLEDLFVRPALRRRGVGTALIVHLARLCRDRGYGRFEWSVLDWNTPALDFYRALGAEALDEWTTHRLTAAALDRLAARS